MKKVSQKQRLKIECVKIATKKKLEKHPKCTFCNKPAITAHHFIHQARSNYLRCDPRNLIPICGECHYKLHNGYEQLFTIQLIRIFGQEWADDMDKDSRIPIKDTMTHWKNKRSELNGHVIGECGAIIFETKKGGVCGECGKSMAN